MKLALAISATSIVRCPRMAASTAKPAAHLREELLGLAPADLPTLLGGPGRARAVYALLREGKDPFTDAAAPSGARARLTTACAPTTATVTGVHRSTDRTTKLLITLADGRAVEAVLIPEARRTTLCISSQVGCARGCTFCLTATMKLARNLTAAELVAQVVLATQLAKQDALPHLRNIVFMGMGEPLDNLEHVRRALEVITGEALGLGFGHTHITVSSVGPSPRAVREASTLPANIAWSLHAADDPTRTALVPTQRASVAELRDAFLDVAVSRRSPLFVEMTMIDGVNDSARHADAVVALFADTAVELRFNLLPMNPIPTSEQRPSPPARVAAFERVLRDAGYFTMVRKTRGADRLAACGQLAVLR